MGPRTALVLTLAALAIPAAAHAQAAAPAATAAQGTSGAVPLPPQNYGSTPGFFRSAPEMAAFERADAGVLPAPAPQPAPMQPVSAPAPAAAPAPVPAAASAAVPAQRVPDPTQNLQWAEQQMDRAEATAVQQRQLNTTPAPVAPGAYNGSTDPNNR